MALIHDDQASQELFKEAGFMLGTHLRAISSHIAKNLYDDGTLRVVAVGSVFRSWKFLKPGMNLRLYSGHSASVMNRFHGCTFQRKCSAIH